MQSMHFLDWCLLSRHCGCFIYWVPTHLCEFSDYRYMALCVLLLEMLKNVHFGSYDKPLDFMTGAALYPPKCCTFYTWNSENKKRDRGSFCADVFFFISHQITSSNTTLTHTFQTEATLSNSGHSVVIDFEPTLSTGGEEQENGSPSEATFRQVFIIIRPNVGNMFIFKLNNSLVCSQLFPGQYQRWPGLLQLPCAQDTFGMGIVN